MLHLTNPKVRGNWKCLLAPPPTHTHTNTLHLGPWNSEYVDVSIYKAWIYALYFLRFTPGNGPANHHMPKSTSVLVDSMPGISKKLLTQRPPYATAITGTIGPRFQMTATNTLTQIRIDHIQNWYLYCIVWSAPVAIVTEKIFSYKNP